jgi:endonuclease/exonuclease/phosphatase (EEP) superfamily protein YafD
MLLMLPVNVIHIILAVCLLGCFLYQFHFIFPYTPLAGKQVLTKTSPGQSIKLFVSNVFMENKSTGKCLEEIRHYQPDLILLVETNHWWLEQTSSLKESYPYQASYPLENTYGMILYSKFKLSDTEILFLVEDQVPSIHTLIEPEPGQHIRLHCLHPAPPSPTENESADERDAELLIVAKSIDTNRYPTIVMGDLNDVAWSGTTKLFQKVSGLLDPRIGRGFFNTFHASYPFLRWPLDHIFHSIQFKLVTIKRVDNIGSDHFPIYVEICYEQDDAKKQEEPCASAEDEELAEEKINHTMEK